MKKNKVLTYILCIVLVEALGFAAGMLTREGTQIYAEIIRKPVLSPPGIVFPIAWTILYALMAVGLARVILCESSLTRSRGILFFCIQFALNLAWCFIFFNAMRFDLALVELLCMLCASLLMCWYFLKTDALSAKLQIPYLIWLCFATYLNIGVLVLN